MKKLFIFPLMVLCILLMGCSPKATALEGADKKAVLAFSEKKTDALMVSLNDHDYDVFSQDFDDEMLKSMSQDAFDKLKVDTDKKFGAYVSRKVKNVLKIGDFYRVNYEVVFEKDAAVMMGVVFRLAEPHKVSGLWFDK